MIIKANDLVGEAEIERFQKVGDAQQFDSDVVCVLERSIIGGKLDVTFAKSKHVSFM